MRLIADLFLLLGALFIFLAALGLLRMPDVYNRIQVGTKAATLGALSFFFGIALLHPEWWSKLFVIAAFILLTNPVSSSSIARAFYMAGIKPWRREADPDSIGKRSGQAGDSASSSADVAAGQSKKVLEN